MKILKDLKNNILNLIKESGVLTVDELTDRLKLSKTAVRQHLLGLEKQGIIERDYSRNYRGRPLLKFKLAPAAQDLYPSLEPTLFRELLTHLMTTNRKDVIDEFFELFWNKRLKKFEDGLAHEKDKSFRTRLQVLHNLLEENGFMPKIKKSSDGTITVQESNCPFRGTIDITSLPCRLESHLIQAALKRSCKRTSYIPADEPTCDFEIKNVKK